MSDHIQKMIDRSRIESSQICLAYRFNKYERDLKGYSPDYLSIPLATGTSCHAGVEMLFAGASLHEAARKAALIYREVATPQRVPDEFANATLDEQMALAYAMVYVWGLKRLPVFLSRFRVVEVEQELTVPLGIFKGYEFHLMSRPDAHLEDQDGLRYALSLKTLGFSQFPQKQAGQDQDWLTFKTSIDNQGLSELLALQHATGLEFDGVIMEWMMKGPRRASGRGEMKVQWSNLLRGWRNETSTSTEYAWRWEWDEVDQATGETRKRRRGKGWQGFAVYDELYLDYARLIELGGTTSALLAEEQERIERESEGSPEKRAELLKAEAMFNRLRLWIRMHEHNLIHPFSGTVLDSQVVSNVFFRSGEEIEEWRAETLHSEARIAEGASFWNSSTNLMDRRAIQNEYFRKSRTACANMYGDVCEFHRVCWGGLDPARVGSGFVPRTPHHDTEWETLGE